MFARCNLIRDSITGYCTFVRSKYKVQAVHCYWKWIDYKKVLPLVGLLILEGSERARKTTKSDKSLSCIPSCQGVAGLRLGSHSSSEWETWVRVVHPYFTSLFRFRYEGGGSTDAIPRAHTNTWQLIACAMFCLVNEGTLRRSNLERVV